MSEQSPTSLDPSDWSAFRRTAHRMLDEAIDGIATIRDGPVWQPIPDEVQRALAEAPLPRNGESIEAVLARYRELIAPYALGNRHPRFFGWVMGGGTPSGMLGALLTAALNINTGGRDHAALYVERALIAWWAQIFGLPPESSGLVTSGTSIASLIAILIARSRALGVEIRHQGLGEGQRLIGYAAESVHHALAKACGIAGLGERALRRIPCDESGGIAIDALHRAIAEDRAAGAEPFLLVGTAGTVDTGASDDLEACARVAAEEGLWFHVDGAFGALTMLAPRRRARLRGIERADSIAFDFHKWLHAPYGAGMILTRWPELHHATFAGQADYLVHATAGTAGGEPWPCDFGPELSRGFLALPIWLTMHEFGLDRLGATIEAACDFAERLGAGIAELPTWRLAAPVRLNIVCARYAPPNFSTEACDTLNEAIAVACQESGLLVPSTTRVGGEVVLRFACLNHRLREEDLRISIDALKEIAPRLAAQRRIP